MIDSFIVSESEHGLSRVVEQEAPDPPYPHEDSDSRMEHGSIPLVRSPETS